MSLPRNNTLAIKKGYLYIEKVIYSIPKETEETLITRREVPFSAS